MVTKIFIIAAAACIILGILLKIVYTCYLINKWKKNDVKIEKEAIKMRLDGLDKRLDMFSETVGKMNWEVMELKEKQNDKINRKRSIK